MGASPGAQLARTEVQKNRRPKSTNCTTLHYDDDDDDDDQKVVVVVEDARGFMASTRPHLCTTRGSISQNRQDESSIGFKIKFSTKI